MQGRKILVIFFVVFTLMLISFSFYTYQMVNTPNILVDQPDRIFLIPEGSTFGDLQARLYEGNYVNEGVSFGVLARLMDYDKSIKPGRYLLKGNMSNLAALHMLRSGQQAPVNVTFNNIRVKQELAEKICSEVSANPDKFLALLNDSSVVQEYGFTTENILCMFIPNTYQVFWTITERELMDRMHQEYERFWNDERRAKANALGMTLTEVSILASVVQAEQLGHPDERPKVAGLYLNRMERNIALQADPTLVYAVGDFSIKRVLNVHKEVDSPYNTYLYTGLPPGPINLPEISSIDAVLNHEEHDYLYMCAKEDFSGYHNFANNLQTHLNNARKYQRALNQARVYR
jgi:UPF0755 protein